MFKFSLNNIKRCTPNFDRSSYLQKLSVVLINYDNATESVFRKISYEVEVGVVEFP